MYESLELVIDQNKGKEAEVIDAINETLRVLESSGSIIDWVWKPWTYS